MGDTMAGAVRKFIRNNGGRFSTQQGCVVSSTEVPEMETQSGPAKVIRYFGDNDEIYDQLQRVIPDIIEDDEPDEIYNEVLIFLNEVTTDSGTHFAYKTVVFLNEGEVIRSVVRTTEIKDESR